MAYANDPVTRIAPDRLIVSPLGEDTQFDIMTIYPDNTLDRIAVVFTPQQVATLQIVLAQLQAMRIAGLAHPDRTVVIGEVTTRLTEEDS